MTRLTKWFIDDDLAVVRLNWFVSQFSLGIFEGIDKVFYLFFEYCTDLGISAKRKYLDVFLRTEGKKLVKKYNIKLETMDNFDYSEPAALEEAYRVICSAVLTKYDSLAEEEISNQEFKVDIRTFMQEQKVIQLQNIMANAFPQLSNGGDADEIISEMQYKLSLIDLQYNVDSLIKLDFMTGHTEVCYKDDKMRFLFKTGLPCVDGDTGGMYSKQIWSFTGQTGGGKTRLAMVHFAYQAAVGYSLDVLVDELEMTAMEIRNMLIAYHIVNLYGGKVKIPDSLINRGELTPEQNRYVESARIDLFESGKYGKIMIRDEGLNVATMEKNMYNFLRHNRNTQLWIIDYAGLIEFKSQDKFAKRLEEYQIIKEAYKICKNISKLADIGVLILNQFTDEGGKAARAGKRIVPGHTQGGQIIQRHSDYDFVMCMTDEQELANMRTLSTPKKRTATGFQNVPYTVDLSVSIFKQQRRDVLQK